MKAVKPEESRADAFADEQGPQVGQSTNAFTPMSEVVPQPVEWLWGLRIPRGEMTLLDGDPGTNKSSMAIDLAARVTTGRPMPDGTDGLSGGALLLSAEDSIRKTMAARLMAAGANMARTWVATKPLSLAADLGVIERAALRVDAQLIVIDPLMVYLGRDSGRDQSVRQALTPLQGFADRSGACILTIRHLTKTASRSALYRGGGSIGIIAAARSALLAGRSPDDAGMRVLCHTKSNLGPIAASLLFEPVDVDGAVALRWHGECDHTAEDILAPPRSGSPKLHAAKEFLGSTLSGGPEPQRVVAEKAAGLGISYGTLERAKVAIGVESKRAGFGPGSSVSWHLPRA